MQSYFIKMQNCKNNLLLANVRLCFFIVAFLHLVVTAIVTLSIDLSEDDDEEVRAYSHRRWKLLTCWFNLITLFYLPFCIYCEWKERTERKQSNELQKLKGFRDIIMTSIIFPTTVYADTLFWRLWHYDQRLIGPPAVFKHLPTWSQHSLHSISLLVVFLDLVLVPRGRPKSLMPGLALMTAFFTSYGLVIFISALFGDMVYPVCGKFKGIDFILLIVLFYVENLFAFTLQWAIIDSVWGRSLAMGMPSAKIKNT